MTDSHHHHQHRPHRLSVPLRTTSPNPNPNPNSTFLYSSQTPTVTPTPTPSKSKHRLSSSSSFSFNSNPNPKSNSNSKSISFIFLLLFSLRSLYSLFPFLRSSSPSFSLFPFSFLVSFLSFFLTLTFSLFSFSSSKQSFLKSKQQQSLFSFSSITHSQQRILICKSILLALVFLLRFSALRYCGTAAMIIAEFMGTVAARRFQRNRRNDFGWVEIRGFVSLFLGLFMLSFGWDRIECFPFGDNCVRIWQLLLPFMSGFLACYEQCVSIDSYGSFKKLDWKRVRLITLFFTTIVLFVPAVISFFVYEGGEDSVSYGNLVWPLANTVVFGVLLSENYFSSGGGGDDLLSFKDSKREFLVIFMCTLILELFYYPNISLWGLLICGLLLYVAVRDLDPFDSNGIGFEDESSQFLSEMVMKPIRHILSERKSRKIALFLLINAAYMVVEFVAGFMSNSLGLISDACHMLFDCAALAIGLYASYISRLPANNHYNYGRGRFEVLSGYTNAVFLVLVGALIVVESFERILDPQVISTNSLLVVSVGGLVVNVIGLIFFHEEHHHAHGMSGGSCSHSHPHSELHSHDSHHHHESSQGFISVSTDCQDNSCSADLGHHSHSSHERKVKFLADSHNIQSFKHRNDDARQHDHHEHAHDHHQHTDHHDHARQHDHHEHTHNHHQHTGHHDHDRQHDHHDHNHHADHHDHNHLAGRHHDHHEHAHDHHQHTDHHDHHDHQHHHDADNHSHDATPVHKKHSHHHIDHNMEGIFLHVLADTLGSVGVVISTLLIKYKGWLVADPACSIFISVLIVSSVIPLLRNSAEVLLQRVPRAHEHDLKDSLANVLKIKGVYGIQKFHSWSFTNTDVVGTLHLHVSTDTDKISVKSQVSHLLHNAGIKDLTLQVECVR